MSEELQLLLDAAFVVMQRNGYQGMTVANVLDEAGMSTRSFYRHFQAKDDLVCALYRREAVRAGERIEAAVAAAGSPLAALEAWIDEILSLRYNRRKAARAAMLSSHGARRAVGYEQEAQHSMRLLIGPLESVLVEGKRAGIFPLADPGADAALIQAVAWGTGLDATDRQRANRLQARSAVLSFCLRALGATAPGR
ncbi:MAG: TetR/AcrR family transcriptional regulator [Acidimicrobiales bacterium]